MENKSNRSDSLKKEIENKNIIVKTLVNYYPKKYLIYIGCKNHTFFFCYRQNIYCSIEMIVIYLQFSLNRQSKVLKKWCVDFRKIAFMTKSHEIIVQLDCQIEKWEIDSCYNLIKKNSSQNIQYSFNKNLLYEDSFQLQLGTKDNWIVTSEYNQFILFFHKGMKGEISLIRTMEIHFEKFLINELGNILIVLLDRKIDIYIQNNFGKWKIVKQTDACDFYFLDNEQFVDMNYDNIITIWQVKPEKLEVAQLQQIELDFKKGVHIYGINYMKQTQLLILQTKFAIYFIKKNNDIFYFAQCIEIQKEPLLMGSEGLFFNIDSRISPRIEILKILEN